MLEVLKKKARKASIYRIMIGILISVASLLLTNFAVLDLIKGPTKISGSYDLEDLEGQYVTMDIQYVLNEYLRVSSQNTKTKSETLTDIGYIVYDSENDIFFGFATAASNESKMDKVIENTWNYIDGTIDELGSLTVKGTIKKITGIEHQYYKETLDEISDYLYDGYEENVYAYYIDENTIQGIDDYLVYISIAVSVFGFFYAIYIAIRFLSGSFDKHIKTYLDLHPTTSSYKIESDFNAATLIGDKIWLGDSFTIYMEGIYARILTNSDLVWAYYFKRNGKNSQSLIKTFDFNKKQVNINIREKDSTIILDHYNNKLPQIIVGYDKELENTFKNNFQTFLSFKYNPAKSANEANNYSNQNI